MANYWESHIHCWCRVDGDLFVEGNAYVQGVNLLTSASAAAANGSRITALESFQATVGSRVTTLENRATSASTAISTLSSRVGTVETVAASAASSAKPQMVLPAKNVITLLSGLLSRVDAVTDALVNAGYARYQ